MKLFRYLFRASWRSLALAVLVGAASGVASLCLIAIILAALSPSGFSTATLALWFVVLCCVVLATRVISQILLTRLAQDGVSRLYMHLSRKILDTPLRQLEEIGPHRLLAVLSGDVAIIAYAMNAVPTLCVNAIILISGAVYLGWLSPPLMVCAIVFCLLSTTCYWFSSAPARKYINLGRESENGLMKQLRGMIEGSKELKIHRDRRIAFVDQVLQEAVESVRRNRVIGFTIQAVAVSWGRLLFLVSIGLLLFVWPQFAEVGTATLTGYTLTILYLMTPLEEIIGWMPHLSRASACMGQIDGLGLMLEHEETVTGDVVPPYDWNRLELDGVIHSYHRENEDDRFQLGPINLALEPGELVFLVGGNGSGKTTLAKLITGLYEPEQGVVRVDGREITQADRESFCQLFSVVFSEATLFDRLLGIELRQLDDRAQSYLAELHIDHKVSVEDGQFSTTELSRGQQKRLALLTAYLEDRPIYVFDEWAADQDPLFKAVFYQQILPELKLRNKAIIVITHDDRYFSVADRVLKLTDGQMVETSGALAMDAVSVHSSPIEPGLQNS